MLYPENGIRKKRTVYHNNHVDWNSELEAGLIGWDASTLSWRYNDGNGNSYFLPKTLSETQLEGTSLKLNDNVIQKTALVTLTATEIVGTAEGDVGHADGAILVAAPGAGYALEFVSALLIYDFDTAAYTGGADDAVIQIGSTGAQVSVTGAITGANLLEAAADAMVRLGSIATELVYAENKAISLAGTALTQPGTAAGVLRVLITYNVITTGL